MIIMEYYIIMQINKNAETIHTLYIVICKTESFTMIHSVENLYQQEYRY